MKFLRQQDGFTLVELMVVVAIIGILSAVAIPNFKKYQAKSKTSEAKLQLASVYSAETSMVSDFDYYVSCLNVAGYDPSAEAKNRYYGVGFTQNNASNGDQDAVDNGAPSTCTTSSTWHSAVDTPAPASEARFGFSGGKKVGGEDATKSIFDTGMGNSTIPAPFSSFSVATNGNEFLAGAVARISADASGALAYDVWAIDQNKNLQHLITGY